MAVFEPGEVVGDPRDKAVLGAEIRVFDKPGGVECERRTGSVRFVKVELRGWDARLDRGDDFGVRRRVAGTDVVIAMIEGQLVQPLLVGRRMELNPLLIFLGLWFGGLYWGIAGIVLATPTLVALKVIAESTKRGRPMMEFLGPNNQTAARDATLKSFVRRLEENSPLRQ